jgi:hypothetical protein
MVCGDRSVSSVGVSVTANFRHRFTRTHSHASSIHRTSRYIFTHTHTHANAFSIRQRCSRRILAGVTNLIGSFKNRLPAVFVALKIKKSPHRPPKSG